jgi:hypothetical protein
MRDTRTLPVVNAFGTFMRGVVEGVGVIEGGAPQVPVGVRVPVGVGVGVLVDVAERAVAVAVAVASAAAGNVSDVAVEEPLLPKSLFIMAQDFGAMVTPRYTEFVYCHVAAVSVASWAREIT